jgi:hypothetical protein
MIEYKKRGLRKPGNIMLQKQGEDTIIVVGNHQGGINKKMQMHANTKNDEKKNVGDRFVSK